MVGAWQDREGKRREVIVSESRGPHILERRIRRDIYILRA